MENLFKRTYSYEELAVIGALITTTLGIVRFLAKSAFDYYTCFLEDWSFLKKRTDLSFVYAIQHNSLNNRIDRLVEEINSKSIAEKEANKIINLEKETRMLILENADIKITERQLMSTNEEYNLQLDSLKREIEILENSQLTLSSAQ